jgi:hypothetical protein
MQEMEATIAFLDPNDAGPGCAALIERGFEVKVMDRISDYDSRVWVIARIATELDDDDFDILVLSIIDPRIGDVLQFGVAPIDQFERACESDPDIRPGNRDDVRKIIAKATGK